MRIIKPFGFLILFVFSTVSLASVVYPFHSAKKRQQYHNITSELRCLVCQDETLAASNAPLAIELKKQVYQMVRAGRSDQQIKSYLVKRYGDFVLFKPPFAAKTYLLWLLPFLLLLSGFVVVLFVVKSYGKNDVSETTREDS